MKHAYRFTLARRAIVVTMDMSADNLHLLYTDHWLADPRNVKVLRLTAPCWRSPEDPDGAVEIPGDQLSKVDEMRGWSAKAVHSFLQQADLLGPAASLLNQGASGEDLFAFTQDQLVTELRLTPFAAKKVLRRRDDFLQV